MSASDHLSTGQFGYQGEHRPERGPALHELASHPDYDHEYGYGAGFYGHADTIRATIASAHGNPEHPVTIHRTGGQPNPGDWVSLSHEYPADMRPGQQVHSMTVPAKHVRLAYSDWTDEAGYFPHGS